MLSAYIQIQMWMITYFLEALFRLILVFGGVAIKFVALELLAWA